MRISDWSSDVCSSDLGLLPVGSGRAALPGLLLSTLPRLLGTLLLGTLPGLLLAVRRLAGLGLAGLALVGLGQVHRLARRLGLLGPGVAVPVAGVTVGVRVPPGRRIAHGDMLSRHREHWSQPQRLTHPPLHRSKTAATARSEEHTSELQSLMRNSYAVFCLKKNK